MSNEYRNRIVHGRGFNADQEYQHQEYPKWVTNASGDAVLVNSEEEETAATTAPAKKSAKNSETLE